MFDKPIPIISVAVITSTFWIKRLIDSIDYPVDHLMIYNNNGRNQLNEELDEIAKTPHSFIGKISICHFPSNIGLVATWNLTIKCFINSPYWFFCNDDVAFTPGFLEEMARYNEDSEVGIVHGGPGDFGDGAWDIFTIKDWVIQSHGLFDENFYPGYGEDVDYIMRMQVKPVKRVPGVGKPFYHGTSFDYNQTGQQTKKSDPVLAQKLNFANETNFEYLTEKWGPTWRITCPWHHPFNNESLPIWVTKFDLEFNRKKYLGF